MANNIIKQEEVISGEMATYPFTNEYVEPTKSSKLFKGWKFNGQTFTPEQYATEEDNPFGPIDESTPKNNDGEVEIVAQWDGFTVKCETNHTSIPGTGDEENELTKIYFYAETESNAKITDGVTLESVSVDGFPITFDNRGETVEDGKNVRMLKALTNDMPFTQRFAKFKSTFMGEDSVILNIKQFGNDEMVTPPFDYMTFTYTWGNDNGTDLDSATVIRDSNLQITTNKTLNDYYVGYLGDSGIVQNYIMYGGDNQRSGDEGARINFKKLINDMREQHILEGRETINVDIYANWFVYKNRENPLMNFNFKLFTSENDDGFTKDGYVFNPTGDTTEVPNSAVSVNNINVNAHGRGNTALHTVESLGVCYTKIITVEYDILSKIAKIIPVTDSIGFDFDVLKFKYNNVDYTIDNPFPSENTYTAILHITNDTILPVTGGSGTLRFTNFSQKINDIEYNRCVVDSIRPTFYPTDDNFVEYSYRYDGNDLLIDYNVGQWNNPPQDYVVHNWTRDCKFNMTIHIMDFYKYYLEFYIKQTLT